MEYVFGSTGDIEILKTKGGSHTDLVGFRQIEQVYPDQIITDHFHVVKKFDSQKDAEGNCYDWYVIDQHYRTIDKTVPIVKKVEEYNSNLETILCEQDEETTRKRAELYAAVCDQEEQVNARLASIESALCELDGLK